MIDKPLAHDRHGLEAPVWMLRKSRHDAPVIHAPAFLAFKVLTKMAAGEGSSRPELGVAGRIGIVMVHAKEKRIRRLPGDSKWSDDHDFFPINTSRPHGSSTARASKPASRSSRSHVSREKIPKMW